MPAVAVVTDFTLILPDRVGSLAQTMGVLASAGVNILGHAGFPAWAGEGVLHLIVDDPDAAMTALRRTSIEIREEREVLVVAVADAPGSLGAVLESIAQEGLNVDLTYALADRRVVIGVNHVARAQQVVSRDMVGGEGFEPPTSSV